jgi:hypothetical protein
MHFFAILFGIFITLQVTTASAAERYALLIGVSRYDSLGQGYQLTGPSNDVELVAKVLADSGVTHIRILAEPPLGQERPTRAAILRELKRLADVATNGDFVYLHFSGHGSRQPAKSMRLAGVAESGGYEDIFLPADVGRWDGEFGAVRRAITNHEIGAAVRRIRARGAFVWAVFDSCHSGAMVRALPAVDEEERERQVSPIDLGIPANLTIAASRNQSALPQALEPDDGKPELGGFVGSYAAQPQEKTVEMRLPRDGSAHKVQGLFTYTLMQAFVSHPLASYRDLGDIVLQTYAALNRQFPTPAFEGPSLDAPVFATQPKQTASQWPIVIEGDAIEIAAGALHRLSRGSILAILPDRSGDAPIAGYAEITELSAMRARLRPVAFGGKPALSLRAISRNAVARLAQPKLSSDIRIALPPQPPVDQRIAIEAFRLLTELAADAKLWEGQVRPNWVAAGEPADIRLMIESRTASAPRLVLLPPSGELPPSGTTQYAAIALDRPRDDLRSLLLVRLRRAVRALALMRVIADIAPRQGDPLIKLNVLYQPRGKGSPRPIAGSSLPALKDGDVLSFVTVNRSATAVDVTMLYIDADSRISAIFPARAGASNRIEVRGKHVTRVRVSAQTAGIEHLLVIATPARPLTPRTDFSFLADEAPKVSRGLAGDPQGPLSLFAQAGFQMPLARGGALPEQIQTVMVPLRIEPARKTR